MELLDLSFDMKYMERGNMDEWVMRFHDILLPFYFLYIFVQPCYVQANTPDEKHCVRDGSMNVT